MFKSLNNVKRGGIYQADLGQYSSSIQGGIRPVLVLQNDIGNRHSPTVTIVPLTSQAEKASYMPTHTLIRADEVNGLRKNSVAQAEQVRTVGMSSLIKKIGSLDDISMQHVEKSVLVQFGIKTGS